MLSVGQDASAFVVEDVDEGGRIVDDRVEQLAALPEGAVGFGFGTGERVDGAAEPDEACRRYPERD